MGDTEIKKGSTVLLGDLVNSYMFLLVEYPLELKVNLGEYIGII